MLPSQCKPLASMLLLVVAISGITPATEPSTLDRFNYILGTQAIGGKYQFTSQDPLVESAEVILAMGASCQQQGRE